MPLNFIKKRLESTVLAQSIDQALLELKSTFEAKKYTRGTYCEHLVAQKLIRSHFVFLAHSLGTNYAEVDLVFLKNKEIHLIEVKSYKSEWSEQALSHAQALRLSRATSYLSTELEKLVFLHLAVVDCQNKIYFYPNILEEYQP